MDAAVDKPAVMVNALKEIAEAGRNRRRWLIFNTGVDNAEHTAEILNGWGIPCAAVHSRLDHATRDRILADYHSGRLRAVSNNNVLTTGFDEPGIDLIGMLRPTKSPGLWVQMAGRGTRICPQEGKRDCVLLDFAGNRARLGPINDPVIPGRPRPNGLHDAPAKICGTCGAYNHTSARVCDFCGAVFPVRSQLQAVASTADIVRGAPKLQPDPVTHTFPVDSINCQKHVKRSTNEAMVMVTYHSGVRVFTEYVKIEQGGGRAQQWWAQRSHERMPETVDEALRLQSELRCPSAIRVWLNKPSGHPEIIGYEW